MCAPSVVLGQKKYFYLPRGDKEKPELTRQYNEGYSRLTSQNPTAHTLRGTLGREDAMK